MPWNLEDLNPTTRFVWDATEKDPKKQEYVDLRLASDEDNKNFFKAVGVKEKVEYKSDPKTRQIQRLTYFDASEEQRDGYNEAIWDFSIADWRMFTDKGVEIPCTKANKCLMMRKSPKFAEWIASCLEKLRGDLQQYQVEVVKNS